MRLKLNLENINIPVGTEQINIGKVEIEEEFKPNEVKEMAQLIQAGIKKIPEILEDLKTGAEKFGEIQEEVEQQLKAEK